MDIEETDIKQNKKTYQQSNKNNQTKMNPTSFENVMMAKKSEKSRKYSYQISLNNPSLFLKFINAIASAVTEIKLILCVSDSFTGLNVESHDSYMHIASKSKFSCSVMYGESESKNPSSVTPINVLANTFLQTLNMSDSIGDSVLTITKYLDTPDKLCIIISAMEINGNGFVNTGDEEQFEEEADMPPLISIADIMIPVQHFPAVNQGLNYLNSNPSESSTAADDLYYHWTFTYGGRSVNFYSTSETEGLNSSIQTNAIDSNYLDELIQTTMELKNARKLKKCKDLLYFAKSVS